MNSGTLRQPVVLPTRIRWPVVGLWPIPRPRSLRGQPLARLQADTATTTNEHPARRAIDVRIENQVGVARSSSVGGSGHSLVVRCVALKGCSKSWSGCNHQLEDRTHNPWPNRRPQARQLVQLHTTPWGDSAPTPHGCCALQSPAPCSTPGHSPATLTASPAARPCADGSSPCRPDSPAPHAHQSAPATAMALAPAYGYGYGNRSSAQAHQPPADRARAPPRPEQPQQWKSWAGQQPLHASPAKQDHIL